MPSSNWNCRGRLHEGDGNGDDDDDDDDDGGVLSSQALLEIALQRIAAGEAEGPSLDAVETETQWTDWTDSAIFGLASVVGWCGMGTYDGFGV